MSLPPGVEVEGNGDGGGVSLPPGVKIGGEGGRRKGFPSSWHRNRDVFDGQVVCFFFNVVCWVIYVAVLAVPASREYARRDQDRKESSRFRYCIPYWYSKLVLAFNLRGAPWFCEDDEEVEIRPGSCSASNLSRCFSILNESSSL